MRTGRRVPRGPRVPRVSRVGCVLLWVLVVSLCTRVEAHIEHKESVNSHSSAVLEAGAGWSREELLEALTRSDRYDKLTRPHEGREAVGVSARVHIYLMQSVETRAHQKLKLNVRLTLSFEDPRLRLNHTDLGLQQEQRELRGESELLDRLWTPHVFLANERHSSYMGLGAQKDLLVRVLPSGRVSLTTRLALIVICSRMRGHFPFDEFECPIMWESWLHNSDEMTLDWSAQPVSSTDAVSLNSFKLRGMRTEASLKQRSSDTGPADGRFGGRYPVISLTLSLARAQIFFIMDHYIPSILLVMISWVTFWIEPDSVPARVLLGSSTMLTFITLAVRSDSSFPLTYVKASEIWFVGCCTFIFGSLVEFAFVNTIWRQGQSVEVKKVNTRHILRSTLGTPRPPRRLLPQERYLRRRTSSLGESHAMDGSHASYYHTLHSGALRGSTLSLVNETSLDEEQGPGSEAEPQSPLGAPQTLGADLLAPPPSPHLPRAASGRRQSISEGLQAGLRGARRIATSFRPGFTRMSAEEVAVWIDRRSRVFFPVAFLVFNCFYWAFVCFV